MKINQFIEELKRRNVFRVATAYAITGWLLIQIIATIAPQLAFPEWVPSFFTILILVGLPIALIFAWAFELTPEGLKKSKEVDITESVTNRTGKKLNGLIITVLSMAVIFLLVERVFFAKKAILDDAKELANMDNTSIAVLPFVNMSDDEGNEYFSDGLSEELLNALAKIEELKVTGRTSSFKFKGQNEDLKTVGAELGVNHILEGSVRKSGDRVRVTAQLIKVDDGFHMWSETYDRELTATNVFDIQDDISREVLAQLKVQLLPEEAPDSDEIPTQDIEAYQSYLKANQMMVNRNYDEIEAAIALYQDAIRIDPGFASAYAHLALAYNSQAYYGNIPLDQTKSLMKANIDKAFNMSPNLSEAYAALGHYEETYGTIESAVEAFEKSLELNPNFVDVYNWLGNLYQPIQLDDEEKQMELYEKAYRIDPLNPLAIYNRARVSLSNEDYEEMQFYIEKNIRINPDFIPTYFLQGTIQQSSPFGRLDKSIEYFDKTNQLDPNFPRTKSLMVVNASTLGLLEMAEQYFEELKERYSESFEYRSVIAYYNKHIGDFTDFENDVLGFYERTGVGPQDNFDFYDLYNYATHTGNISRVLPYFRNFDSGLFQDSLSTLTKVNADEANALIPLLRKSGNSTQANVLAIALCDYANRSSEWLKNGTKDQQFLRNQASCAFVNADYESLAIIFRDIYENHRDIFLLYNVIQDIQQNYPDGYIDSIEELHKELLVDLAEQRNNTVEYFKANERWNAEWEVSE